MSTENTIMNQGSGNGRLHEPPGPYRLPHLERRLDAINDELVGLADSAERLVEELYEAVYLVGVRVERNRARERRRSRRRRNGQAMTEDRP